MRLMKTPSPVGQDMRSHRKAQIKNNDQACGASRGHAASESLSPDGTRNRFWLRADNLIGANVCFSNRPFGVKHFQTIHHCSVDVAHGLALLFGIGTKAVPSWDPRTRWHNLSGGLTVRRTAGRSGHANSPHPSSREAHLSTAQWSSSFLLLDLTL